MHEVLRRFGAHEPSRSFTDVDLIRRSLDSHLEAVLLERAGPSLGGGLRIQRRILQERLGWFAREQVRSVVDGWRIRDVEFKLEHELAIPGQDPVTVTGSIDRIDAHQDGRLRILDYKTGKEGANPDGAHQQKDEWIDLQLPLYRHLYGKRDGAASIEIGYWQIGSAANEVGWKAAQKLGGLVDDAVAKAVEIVQAVRAGELAMNPEYQPRGEDPLEILCRTAQQMAGEDDDASDEADDGGDGAQA